MLDQIITPMIEGTVKMVVKTKTGISWHISEREVLSAKTSVPSTRSVDDHPVYCNIMYNGTYPEDQAYADVNHVGLRCYSMPDYVNVQIHHGVAHG